MKFIGELLIFVLLFITNLRVFFVISPKRDPLVALAPFTFVLSILQITAWGFDLFTCLGFVISLLVLLSNFHAMFRYSERLYVDHYSVLMRVWAVFTDLLSLGAIIILLMYVPVELKNNKLNIIEEKINYTGDFSGGFSEAGIFDSKTAFLYEYSLKERNKDIESSNQKAGFSTDVVLFVPDKRGDSFGYRPLMQLLASEGYVVCSADFFARNGKWFYSILDSKIFRRSAMITESIYNNADFMAQREFYTYNISLECNALYNMLKERYGNNCNIFIISDSMSNDAVNDFVNKKKNNISGCFALDSISEYKSAGYGCTAQIAPLVNSMLGLEKEKKFITPRIIVEKLKEVIVF